MKRKWFQIHLSTAIVLMFVAGLIMVTNFSPNFPAVSAITLFDGHPIRSDYRGAWAGNTYGCPFTAYPQYSRIAGTRGFGVTESLDISAVIANALFGALLLYAIFNISEHLIRRSEARKP